VRETTGRLAFLSYLRYGLLTPAILMRENHLLPFVRRQLNFTAMHGPPYLQIVDGLGLLIFFVVNPLLFIAIGYAA
jgi:hypothetical protein